MARAISDGAIHAMGNGRLLVYGRGANILHVFGEPYTTQSLLSGTWTLADGTLPTCVSHREERTAVWSHQLLDGATPVGVLQAFVATDILAYLGHMRCTQHLTFRITLPGGVTCYEDLAPILDPPLSDGARLILIAPDTNRILFYPAGARAFLNLRCWGDGFHGVRRDGDEVLLDVSPGSVYLAFSGGVSYPDVEQALAHVLHMPYAEHRERRAAVDRAFAARILRPPAAELSAGRDIGRLCESVAFLIAAQQSDDGGIMAGYPYPFAYVRDQYGTCRGLLALGLHEEVRRNIDFRYRKWQRFGTLANAESMGHDRIRHVHENDDVEQTAYTILQAIDYVEAIGDHGYLAEIFPLLEWCLAAQIPHLRGGMLPFNGDETYVAGGFLPRSALNDGSMEATLLFVEASRKLLASARRLGLMSPDRIRRYDAVSQDARAAFRRNFQRAGIWVANAPERASLPDMPSYRHGVCERCGTTWFGWLRRTDTGRYICPQCTIAPPLPASAPAPLEVQSAQLLPPFIHAVCLQAEEQKAMVSRAAARFAERGYLPTVPGGTRAVGYDEALLLYGLAELRDTRAASVFQSVIDRADSADAWAEYYEEGQARGTRCRPWESGISIAAIVRYLQSS